MNTNKIRQMIVTTPSFGGQSICVVWCRFTRNSWLIAASNTIDRFSISFLFCLSLSVSFRSSLKNVVVVFYFVFDLCFNWFELPSLAVTVCRSFWLAFIACETNQRKSLSIYSNRTTHTHTRSKFNSRISSIHSSKRKRLAASFFFTSILDLSTRIDWGIFKKHWPNERFYWQWLLGENNGILWLWFLMHSHFDVNLTGWIEPSIDFNNHIKRRCRGLVSQNFHIDTDPNFDRLWI